MNVHQPRNWLPLLAAVGGPLLVTAVLVPFRSHIANTDAALIMLAVVVAVAALGSRPAGYLAAAVSALAFDFFLTKPYGSFNIAHGSDIQTTILLIVIGVAVTEIAVWGRRQHEAATRRAGYLAGMHTAAEAALAGRSKGAVIAQVNEELCTLLDLSSCRFQSGVAGLGDPARLHHDGRVTVGRQVWPVDREGLPPERPLELLLERHGTLQGRFLMVPHERSAPTLERRLVAAALADQVSAAIGADG